MESKLNQFLADLSVLAKKVQNFHWNITGRGFFSIHAQLDKMYEDLNEVVDEVAERVLAIKGRPLSTLKSYLEISKIKEGENKSITIDEALKTLISDFRFIVDEAKEVKVCADKNNDYGTSAMMDEYIIKYEKLLWMLNSFEC
ncbi:DNA starvation/stationary phase protection protein [Sneathia vaginalis]|uniref:Dps family protein n=1 Tax=Sneathia TaxID=168808 RepID=UPI001D034957|nr:MULTISPECIES: DNA starvation/stationary phase protection protein [Sneathia]MDK9581933.1 DNA starvation/stationary phase protection protein [Sneathia vaginalis]